MPSLRVYKTITVYYCFYPKTQEHNIKPTDNYYEINFLNLFPINTVFYL